MNSLLRANRGTVGMGLSCLLLAGVSAAAQAELPASYYKGHYVLTMDDDPVAAKALFEKAYAARELTDTERDLVRRRLAECVERIVAADLARLCPAETIAYMHLARPGELFERLTTMLGIPTKPITPMLAARPPAAAIDWRNPNPAAFIPEQVAMSPALMRSLRAFRGAAVAFTGLHLIDHGDFMPTGLVILDAGDADGLRGLIEMAAQFAPAGEPIEGHPTFAFPMGITAALTERLLLVGSSRGEVEGALGRIRSGGKGSLAESAAFAALAKSKAGSTFFGFLDAQRALALLPSEVRTSEEFQVARALADLDSLVGAAFGIGTLETGLGLDLSVTLKADHHNLVYNLIRTPAMSRRSLACVPAQAAFVFGFGLNPPNASAAESTAAKGKTLQRVTGLDLFRELFGNIEEICLYVAPPAGNLLGGRDATPAFIPNGALIIAASDAGRSEALWTQLLSLPATLMPQRASPPESIEVAGLPATAFTLPEVGRIFIGRIQNCLVVTARQESLAAAFKAAQGGKSILTDAGLAPVVSRLGPDVGMLMILHAGRALRAGVPIAAAAGGENGPPPQLMSMLSGTLAKSLDSTLVYAAVAESDTELNLRVCLAGLPNVNELLKQVGPMVRLFSQLGAPAESAVAERVSPRPDGMRRRRPAPVQ